ncbi:YdgH/BhsA/McbA-like domain containing protein [Musicola keenii]|uniref:YdgH/BhsA/McbA-like domain containing protein n=1 Tax=Musicola keenii TaxID=2884250 RepID=UPI00177FDF95|nr:YdgH/BhsA/McbA-like domain containing protein [Musicola keenii]
MNMIKNIAAIFALATLSFGSMAATEVHQAQGAEIGTVSASASSLGELNAELAAKADAAGAKSFRIISASGSDSLRGVAELYN